MSAGAIARLRERVRGHTVKMSHVPETCELCAIRALLDAHAALEAAHTEARNNSEYARGVADERARVVADLRMRASAGELSAVPESLLLRVLADLYESGEREEKETIPSILIFGFPPVNP